MSEEFIKNLCKLDKVFEAVNVVNKVEGKSIKKRKNSDLANPRNYYIPSRTYCILGEN